MSGLSHLDEAGRPLMVDVTAKQKTERSAVASGIVRMSRAALAAALGAGSGKGEVLRTAELAGIMAAKRTADLIPLCHPLPLGAACVEIAADEKGNALKVTASVRVAGQTGVEMEALTAVSVACLTIYDMLKSIDRTMAIERIRLEEKAGGRSGAWSRRDDRA